MLHGSFFYLFWLPRHFLRLDSGFVDYILVLVTLNHQDIKAYNRINKTHYELLHKWSQNWILLDREYFTPLNCKCVSGVLLFPLSKFGKYYINTQSVYANIVQYSITWKIHIVITSLSVAFTHNMYQYICIFYNISYSFPTVVHYFLLPNWNLMMVLHWKVLFLY
jgi:hypothetical protein